MKIKDTICQAKELSSLWEDDNWKSDIALHLYANDAADCIKELLKIIDWYDKNQRRLIRTLTRLIKRRMK